MTFKLIGQHHCPASEGFKDPRSALVTQSLVISGRISEKASERLISEVFSIMHHDEVGQLARKDPLIVSLGNQWLERNVGNKLMRGSYTSGIMRLATNLLVQLRMFPVVHTSPSFSCASAVENYLWDYIRPQHFDKCVTAALKTAYQDMDDIDDLKAPSNAIKLGHELKRLSNIKLGLAIRSRDQHTKDECRDFNQLMETEWGRRVTKLARVNLVQKQFGI